MFSVSELYFILSEVKLRLNEDATTEFQKAVAASVSEIMGWFDDDTDTNLYLSVKNEGKRVDLGEMHIDSAVPVCVLPEEFSSWHWYFGDGGRTVTLTGISELLDENETRIYDNGSERSFVYSPEEGTLTFTLEKGWHNIGIALSDTAGNINYIQERTNIYIGYFWLWVILRLSRTAGRNPTKRPAAAAAREKSHFTSSKMAR